MSLSTSFYIISIFLISYHSRIINAVNDSEHNDQEFLIPPAFFDLNVNDQLISEKETSDEKFIEKLNTDEKSDQHQSEQLTSDDGDLPGNSEAMLASTDLNDDELDNQNKQLALLPYKLTFDPAAVRKPGSYNQLESFIKSYIAQQNSKKQTIPLSLLHGSVGNDPLDAHLNTLSQMRIDPSLLKDKKIMPKKQPLLALEYNSNKGDAQTGSGSNDEQQTQLADGVLEIYQPKKQAGDQGDEIIEEISTDNLMDEREYELGRLLKEFMKQNNGKVFGHVPQQNSFKEIQERSLTPECAKFAREYLSGSANDNTLSKSYVNINTSKSSKNISSSSAEKSGKELPPDSIDKNNSPQSNSDASEKVLAKKVEFTISQTYKKFKPLIEYDDFPFLHEHKQRARAFLTCCFPTYNVSIDLVEKYVAAYGRLDEQENMIEECYKAENGLNKEMCKDKRGDLKDNRHHNDMFLSRWFPTDEALREKFRKLIDSIDVENKVAKNVVSNYNDATKDYCDYALVLLWSPRSLLECDKIVHKSFINTSDYPRYLSFSNTISNPFVNKAFSILRSLQTLLSKLVNNQNPTVTLPPIAKQEITYDTIDRDMNAYKNSFILITGHQRHALIAHFSERARVYTLCCKPGEKIKMFNDYITSFSENSRQGYALDKVIRTCVREQTPIQDLYAMQTECNTAYDELTKAMNKRQIFINKYSKQNPNMLRDLRHALELKEDQFETIQGQNAYVNEFCPDSHIFELMFDVNKLFICETLIRRGLRSSSDDYNLYVTSQSKLFKDYVVHIWEQMKKIIDDLNTDEISSPTDNRIPNPVPKPEAPKPKPDQTFRIPKVQAQSQFSDTGNGASSMHMMIYQCSSLILLVFIRIILF